VAAYTRRAVSLLAVAALAYTRAIVCVLR